MFNFAVIRNKSDFIRFCTLTIQWVFKCPKSYLAIRMANNRKISLDIQIVINLKPQCTPLLLIKGDISQEKTMTLKKNVHVATISIFDSINLDQKMFL